jgi:hypothetical protein
MLTIGAAHKISRRTCAVNLLPAPSCRQRPHRNEGGLEEHPRRGEERQEGVAPRIDVGGVAGDFKKINAAGDDDDEPDDGEHEVDLKAKLKDGK